MPRPFVGFTGARLARWMKIEKTDASRGAPIFLFSFRINESWSLGRTKFLRSKGRVFL